jgi:bifunctional ADP-heptose synthase (sugar kinase/adenylyltransferase)
VSKVVAKAERVSEDRAVNFRAKIVPWAGLPQWRAAMRANGRKLVVTNGCFDLLSVAEY